MFNNDRASQDWTRRMSKIRGAPINATHVSRNAGAVTKNAAMKTACIGKLLKEDGWTGAKIRWGAPHTQG